MTLWEDVHAFLGARAAATRAEILEHFKLDDEPTVRSILNDLVESGLVLRSGAGKESTYRAATSEELEELSVSSAANARQTNEALVWVHVCRGGPWRKDQLMDMLRLSEPVIDLAIEGLLASARIRSMERPDGVY